MNLATIAWKSLKQRALASSLTALNVALGVTLMVGVLVIYGVLETTFSQRSINYHLIVGPKGSPLQLVLSTVYHTNPPIENLPYRYYLDLKKEPLVKHAIPIAIGDTTQKGQFPIVGTIPDYFEIDCLPGRPYRVDGDFLRKPFDAVIGHQVAVQNGWKPGSQFQMIHGGGDGHVHDEKFTVVGVLETTGTPNDRSVFVHLDGFYLVSGHDKPFDEAIRREREFYGLPPMPPEELKAEAARLTKLFGHDHSAEESHAGKSGEPHFHPTHILQKEVTSVLLEMKSEEAAIMFAGTMKKGFKAQAVNPIREMNSLMVNILEPIRMLLLILTSLIIIVSGVGIFVSIYNSMSDRRREIAIMRALGARRSTVFGIVLMESVLLCVGGGLVGWLLGHGLVYCSAPLVEARAGIVMNPWSFHPAEGTLFPILLALAILVGYLPGLTAYRTDVAQALQNS